MGLSFIILTKMSLQSIDCENLFLRLVMKKLAVVFLVVFLSSCVSGLNGNQERKLVAIKQAMPEHYQEEKNVGLAAALGLLPGGGSLYTKNYVVGVVDLLLWPMSVLWDPINGLNGAKEINYYSSKSAINRQKNKEIDELQEQLVNNKITEKQFTIRQLKISRKYNLDNLL